MRFDELAEDFLTDYRINGKKSLTRAKASVDHLFKSFSGFRVNDADLKLAAQRQEACPETVMGTVVDLQEKRGQSIVS